jgi:hypothetical protein
MSNKIKTARKVNDLYPERDPRLSFFDYQKATDDANRGLPVATVYEVKIKGRTFPELARSYSQAQAQAARKVVS